jgi:glutaredoxin
MKLKLTLLALPVLFFAAAASSQVYRWTDAQGRVHYGDSPPQEAKTEQVKISVQSFGGPAVVDYVSILKRPIKSDARPSRADVALYTTSWCGVCKQAKAWLSGKQIPFQEYDVENNEQARSDFLAMGGGGVPVILVGEQRMRGFSAGKLEGMLKKSGY